MAIFHSIPDDEDVEKVVNINNLCISLTRDGRQVRAWIGIPIVREADHIDSGTNKAELLFSISGGPEGISWYLKKLLKTNPQLQMHEEWNGVKLYY